MSDSMTSARKYLEDFPDLGEAGSDPVDQPDHYTIGGIESIDVIEAKGLGYHAGNVVKYMLRYRFKGTPLEDLKKARSYLDRLITLMEGGTMETVSIAADPDPETRRPIRPGEFVDGRPVGYQR